MSLDTGFFRWWRGWQAACRRQGLIINAMVIDMHETRVRTLQQVSDARPRLILIDTMRVHRQAGSAAGQPRIRLGRIELNRPERLTHGISDTPELGEHPEPNGLTADACEPVPTHESQSRKLS